jgi:putative DNA primase/helicase
MMPVSTQIQNSSPVVFHKTPFKNSEECTRSFIEAMAFKGIDCREKIITDGKIHRFASGGKGDQDCWYVFHGMAGAFGDWSKDIQEKWNLKNDSLSYQDRENLRQHIEKAQKASDEEIRDKHEGTALIALARWRKFSKVGQSPYLERKKVEAFGVSFQGDLLMVPLRDIAGKLWSFQSIAPDSTKRFLVGGRKKGCFHHIGTFEEGKPVYVAEGYATGASVYMVTRQTTVVAFDAGNLDPVIDALKRKYPQTPIIIAGDDDIWKDHNKGREKAEQAAHKYGCSFVLPKFKNTDNKPTDFNDLYVLEGVDEVKRQLEHVQSPYLADPLPVKSNLLPVSPFTLDMLPASLQPWIKDVAYRKQCPMDFVAIPAIVMLASLIGARCTVKPHEKDDWTVVPNLWGGILGDPGTLKSPACSEALFPLGYLESKAMEGYTEERVKYEAEKAAISEAKEFSKCKTKGTTKQIGKEGSLEEGSATSSKDEPPEPILKRYKVSDATVEKMHEILCHNPKGVLVYRDELMGFLESWEKKGHETDRTFYLEAWNGCNGFNLERIARGTVHAKNVCVSVLGTTQPDKISSYLHKAIKKLDNDGLLQRFQLLVYPDKKLWKLVDEYPDSLAKNHVLEICKTIDAMDFKNYGAQETEPYHKKQFKIPFFRLSPEAQPFFHDWLKNLQGKIEGQDYPIILQHLSKYRSLMPSLALIFHIIDNADGRRESRITLSSVKKAAAWCVYLESHARRIYGMVLDTTFEASPILSKAEELLAWMRKQSTNRSDQPLKRRFILRYSKFRSSKDLDPLLSDLLQMGYIQEGAEGTFCIVPQPPL